MGDESELSRLITLVAHELRTPLSVVSGYLKMLASERGGSLTDAQRRAVSGADRACVQLTTLANEVSWLGKLERGEVAPNRAPLPLAPLLREIAGGHTPHDEHPVNVEAVDGPGSGELTITADAIHLRRALNAMLSAVVRAAPDHATVQIASVTRPREPRATGGGPALLVIAIAPVSQIDSLLAADLATLDAPNESQGGLGVSLPLVRRLMALDHGSIHVRKTDGSFSMVLTLANALA
jgi:signal transduction histidine kinase